MEIVVDQSYSISRRIMLTYSLLMTVNTINGLICSPISSVPHPDPSGYRVRTESSRLLMKRSGEDLEMSATFTSSRSSAASATSTLVPAPSFVMIPTATGQFVQPVILPATTAQLGGPLVINGQLTAAAQPFMVNGQQMVNSVASGGVPRRRIRVIRPGAGGGRRGARFRGGGGGGARFRGGGGGGGGGGRGRRFRRLRGGGGGGRSAPIVIVDSDGQQGRQQVMSQPLIQPIIQPVIQPVVSQQPFVGNPLIQSHSLPVQVPQSMTSISVTASPQTQSAPALYQTTVTSIQDSKGKNTIGANHGGTVFVPAAPVVNLMMVPTATQKPEKSRRQSLRDRRRNRVRTRVKLRLKEWVNTE